MPLRLIFAGTPVFAARHLHALLESEHEICAVYTQPDRPAGRGKKLTPSPVKMLAEQHKLIVEQPHSLKDSATQAHLADYRCDLMVVVAYGLLLPQAVLDIPARGCINVHGSVLPRWRGAAPIQRAIEAGDRESGVTIMQMDAGLDTGAMLLINTCPILPRDNSADLHDRLCEIGPPALLQALQQIEAGKAVPREQNDAESCYARKIEKHEAAIDWSQPVALIDRKVRAFNPFPICYSHLEQERLRIHRARPADTERLAAGGQLFVEQGRLLVQCGDGRLQIEELQLPGKKAISATDFVNGRDGLDTLRLGTTATV